MNILGKEWVDYIKITNVYSEDPELSVFLILKYVKKLASPAEGLCVFGVMVREDELVDDEAVLDERRGEVQQEEQVEGRLFPTVGPVVGG